MQLLLLLEVPQLTIVARLLLGLTEQNDRYGTKRGTGIRILGRSIRKASLMPHTEREEEVKQEIESGKISKKLTKEEDKLEISFTMDFNIFLNSQMKFVLKKLPAVIHYRAKVMRFPMLRLSNKNEKEETPKLRKSKPVVLRPLQTVISKH